MLIFFVPSEALINSIFTINARLDTMAADITMPTIKID